MSQFLASAGLLLIPCPVVRAMQFGPNSDQNYKTLDLMILRKDFL